MCKNSSTMAEIEHDRKQLAVVDAYLALSVKTAKRKETKKED